MGRLMEWNCVDPATKNTSTSYYLCRVFNVFTVFNARQHETDSWSCWREVTSQDGPAQRRREVLPRALKLRVQPRRMWLVEDQNGALAFTGVSQE